MFLPSLRSASWGLSLHLQLGLGLLEADLWVQDSLENGSWRFLNFTAAGLFCGLCWAVLVG